MKNLFAFTALVAVLVLCAAPAAAQAAAFRATVRFGFTAGNQWLAAGEYQFTVDTEHMLTVIQPVAGGATRLVRLVPGSEDRPLAAIHNGLLRFDKYGDVYVLNGMWKPGSTAGKSVAGSRRPPKELAQIRLVNAH